METYHDRDSRNKFITLKYPDYLGKRILNIGGGGEKHLKKYLAKDIEYLELDIDGKPDIRCNLEQELPVPADNNSFDTVIATDVLEHLENHLEVLEEMIRISSKFIIISLPNSWVMMKSQLFDSAATSGKFYGFPIEKPQDRHKWFFNAVEAENFYLQVEKKYSLKVLDLHHIGYYHKNKLKGLVRYIVGSVLGIGVRKNMFSSAVWCVLEIPSSENRAQ